LPPIGNPVFDQIGRKARQALILFAHKAAGQRTEESLAGQKFFDLKDIQG